MALSVEKDAYAIVECVDSRIGGKCDVPRSWSDATQVRARVCGRLAQGKCKCARAATLGREVACASLQTAPAALQTWLTRSALPSLLPSASVLPTWVHHCYKAEIFIVSPTTLYSSAGKEFRLHLVSCGTTTPIFCAIEHLKR